DAPPVAAQPSLTRVVRHGRLRKLSATSSTALFAILLSARFKPSRPAGDVSTDTNTRERDKGGAVSALMIPDTRQRADRRLLQAIPALDRLCAGPTARERLEAQLGAELTHRLLAAASRTGVPRG